MELIFFFNDTATTEIYALSLHDALPIYHGGQRVEIGTVLADQHGIGERGALDMAVAAHEDVPAHRVVDRKSTRLNSSHANISYAVFCLKKNKKSSSDT